MRKPYIRYSLPEDENSLIEIIRRSGTGVYHIRDGSIFDLMMEPILVAELDGKVIGFLVWIQGNRHAYVDTLAVLPEYQKEGVGAWLMHELGFILHDFGVKHIFASTLKDEGEPVRNMALRLGYDAIGEFIAVHKYLNGGGVDGRR